MGMDGTRHRDSYELLPRPAFQDPNLSNVSTVSSLSSRPPISSSAIQRYSTNSSFNRSTSVFKGATFRIIVLWQHGKRGGWVWGLRT
jgi:hypothetical protein